MRIQFLIAFLIISCVEISLAQTNLYWKVGLSVGLDFTSGTVVINPVDTCKSYQTQANTSVCNANGEIIFYSNGYMVYDKLDRVMPNGSNFNHSSLGDPYINAGGPYPLLKGAIIIPFPYDTNKFYMFYENMEWTIDGNYLPDKLRYLVVDKTLHGGLGDVTVKDQIVIQNDTLAFGQLLATKHGNGKDYWLIVRKYRSDKFYKFLIDSGGIQSPIIQHIGMPFPFSYVYHGYPNISKDGTKIIYPYACYNTTPVVQDGQFDIFDFDRCTGDLKNYQNITYPYLPDSVIFVSSCISPNKHFFYASDLDKLYQFDLTAANIFNTRLKIDTRLAANSKFWQMEIAPDNKIYCSPYGGSHFMHVINKPDSLGLACNAIQNQINFGTGWHWTNGGLPNVPNFTLGAIAPCGNVGVEQITNPQEQLTIYPNPCGQSLVISHLSLGNTIQVYDVLGRAVVMVSSSALLTINSVEASKSIAINVANLPSGIYFLKATDEKGNTFNTKFVKQ